VLGKLYHIEGSVDYMTAWDTVALGAAVVDSQTSKIGAGIAFRGLLSGKDGVGGIDARAGIAFPLADSISLGVGLRYINVNAEEEVSAGVWRSVGLVDGFTMDAAIRVQPSPMFQISALAVNFLDRGSAYVPVQLGGAAALSVAGIANIGADLLFDITTFENTTGVTFGFSAEFFVAQIVPLRLGYGYDVQRELHMLTGGAGYTDRSVGFDLSVQQELSRGNETRILGSFRYYVQ
jgi:hypothetical protein